MIPKSGYRFPAGACARAGQRPHPSAKPASAGEGRSEKIKRKPNVASQGPAVHSRERVSSASGVGKRCRAGGKMLNSLRAVARFFQNTIGWNRIGVLLSLAIITVAVLVLVHMLRNINVDEVIAALKATEQRHILAAAAFVEGGYFTLTFYDWFALRTIGRKEIPYRIAALSGFTSY